MRPEGHCFGERNTFAIEIGPLPPAHNLRVVDLWAAGIELSCDDHHAYVPQFCNSITKSLRGLDDGPPDAEPRRLPTPWPDLSAEENHRRLAKLGWSEKRALGVFRLLDWGPTTDNVTNFLFEEGPDVIFTFSFWRPRHPRPEERGRVFQTKLPRAALVEILRAALDVLANER